MSLAEWFQWLEQTPVSTAIAESIWLFPLLEGSHILALPFSVGMIVMFDLHLLGLALAGSRAASVMTEMLRWSKFGFAVMFITGGLLFMSHAGTGVRQCVLPHEAGLPPDARHQCRGVSDRLLSEDGAVGAAGGTPLGARVCGGLSLIVWIGVIVCGRTMAYQF